MNGWEALSSIIGGLILLELLTAGVSRIILAIRGKIDQDDEE